MASRHEHKLSDELLSRIGHDVGRALFVPRHFEFGDLTELLAFIETNPLAHFTSVHDGNIRQTAAPIIAGRTRTSTDGQSPTREFVGHMARRNTQTEAIHRGETAVALITGPDAYISPRWSIETRTLPTWSYVSVQLRGQFEAVDSLADTRQILVDTIARMEDGAERAWSLNDAKPELVEMLLEHILAFRFHVSDIQGIQRLNQNKSLADRRGIVDGLRRSDKPGAHRIADLMQTLIDEPSRMDAD